MKIRIEVVYALPDAQTVIEMELEEGARVMDALAASGLPEGMPGGSSRGSRIGIWGRPASAATTLRDRDRVEIYRELVADPKQARRRRVGQQGRRNPPR